MMAIRMTTTIADPGAVKIYVPIQIFLFISTLFFPATRLLNPQNSHMTAEQTSVIIKDTNANPAPLGLFGFGMTTVLDRQSVV